ncbi:MAG TPA: potassium transporter TrkA [Natrialbaceae archaeon]|nr:potassium transporter TrkA [Natrialbaceae archaeon]
MTAAAAVGVVDGAILVVGLAALSGGVATGLSLLFRWYAGRRAPEGVAVLVGLAAIALSLNTTAALSSAIVEPGDLFHPTTALFTVGTFAAGTVAADVGNRMGDRIAVTLFGGTGGRELSDVTQLVRTGGRVIDVELPEHVEDIDGYDPVPDEEKAAIAGTRMRFPRRLTVAELQDRLVARLREDHGIGRVDLELTAEGEVEYLAVGTRMAGIGPTLGPGSVIVAVRADPAFAASPGDTVQVWTRGDGSGATTSPEPERVVTAELRGAVEDVATLAVDAFEADRLDPMERYRLVTLPREPSADREFASLLRAADETMDAVRIAPDSALAGIAVGALDVTVVALRPQDGRVEPIPPRHRVLAADETVYVVGRPDVLRRFEAAAEGSERGSGDTEAETTS